MISNELLDKYPRVRKFLRKHPEMNLDSALVYTENKLKESSKADSPILRR